MPDWQTAQEAASVREDAVFHELLRWVDRTPVPTSRPLASPSDEAAGLVILDLSLRLEHVSRVTDSLRIIDQSHVQRSITLDVDLRGLTREQREALAVRRGLTPHEGGAEEDRSPQLWVPVSRHSRMDLSPVVVRDASDQVLPRLTQGAASKTLVAGLSRLLKSIRDAAGDRRPAPESMWLIVQALQLLVEEGPLGPDDNARREHGADDDADGHRSGAMKFLREIPMDVQQSLDRLIEVAYSEYVLVVMLPARTSQAHLQFDAPLIPAARQSTSWFRRNAPGREYTIDYRTEITRSLGSYHVTVEVAEEIYVRRYILSSAADKASVAELSRDLRRLWAALGSPRRTRRERAPAGPDRRQTREDPASPVAGREDRRIRVVGRRKDGSDRREGRADRRGSSGDRRREGSADRRGSSGDRRREGSADRRRGGPAGDRRAGAGDRRRSAAVPSALATASDGRRVGSLGRRVAPEERRQQPQDRRQHAEDLALWLAFESIVMKLAHIGRRRNLEHRRYRRYIEQQELGHPTLDESEQRSAPMDDLAVMQALADGEVNLLLLDRLADIYAKRPLHESMGPLRLDDFRQGLPKIADWLQDARLGEDVIVENDPRENGAHAQWRHQPLPFGSPGLEPIPARVFLTVADESPALADSVRNMLLGLIAVTFSQFLFLALAGRAVKPNETQTDALVAVLLLVPGILLSRLDIPSTNSVLGQLRAAPRKVAYLSVVLTSGLAVAVSTGWAIDNRLPAFGFVLVALMACLGFSVVETRRRTTRRNRGIPDAADVPWWLRCPAGGPDEARRHREHVADVVFDAIDGRQVRSGRRNLMAVVRVIAWRAWRKALRAENRTGGSVSTVGDGSVAAGGHETPRRALANTLAGRRALRGAELARVAARAVTANRSGVMLSVVHAAGTPGQRGQDSTGQRFGAFDLRVGGTAPRPDESRHRAGGAEGAARRRRGTSSTLRGPRDAAPRSTFEPQEAMHFSAGDCYVEVVGCPSGLGTPDIPEVTGYARTRHGIGYSVATPLGPTLLPPPLATLDFLIGVRDDREVAELLLRLLTFETTWRRSDLGGQGAVKPGHVLVRDVRFPEMHTGLGTHEAAAALKEQSRRMLRVSVALPDDSPSELGELLAGDVETQRTRSAHPLYGHDSRRLALTQYLAELCVDGQTDLYVSDDPLATGRTWRTVVAPRPGPAVGQDPSDDLVPELARRVSDGRDHHQTLLVTLAGSTGGYDVKAAVNLCLMVRDSPASVAIVSVSVARLQEQPVISLVLRRPFPPAGDGQDASGEVPLVPGDRASGLRALTDFLGDEQNPLALTAAFEQSIGGRALLVTALHTAGLGAVRPEAPLAAARPLWLQWSWPGTHPTAVGENPAAIVQRLLEEQGAVASLVQHRSRCDRDGRVKGSAQLLVRLPKGDGDLGKRVRGIEHSVRRTLADTHRSPHEVLFRLARDEGWLSRE